MNSIAKGQDKRTAQAFPLDWRHINERKTVYDAVKSESIILIVFSKNDINHDLNSRFKSVNLYHLHFKVKQLFYIF